MRLWVILTMRTAKKLEDQTRITKMSSVFFQKNRFVIGTTSTTQETSFRPNPERIFNMNHAEYQLEIDDKSCVIWPLIFPFDGLSNIFSWNHWIFPSLFALNLFLSLVHLTPSSSFKTFSQPNKWWNSINPNETINKTIQFNSNLTWTQTAPQIHFYLPIYWNHVIFSPKKFIILMFFRRNGKKRETRTQIHTAVSIN